MPTVTVNYGKCVISPREMGINAEGEDFILKEIELLGERGQVSCVGTEGVHCVLKVACAEDFDIERIGDALCAHELFPNGAVCDFLQPVSEKEFILRVWEKGRENTHSLSSAVSAAEAAFREGVCGEKVTVHLAAGSVEVERDKDGNIKVTGPSEIIFAL